jgi:hypothetical protein
VVNSCLEDGSWSGCDYGPLYTEDVDDSCDQTDNDCDGSTDEGAGNLLEPELGELGQDGLDNNCNGYPDEPGGVMVKARPFLARWMDVYEIGVFSSPDCTGTQYGVEADEYPAGWPAEGPATETLYACSLPGILPSGYLSWYRAQRACEAQGKVLCDAETWSRACGNLNQGYPYGDVFVQGTCNDGLGGIGELAETGAFADCRESDRIHDLSGNLAEWVQDWDTGGSGYGVAAGHHYLPEICSMGAQCHQVDTGNPADYAAFRNALDCVVYFANFELYPAYDARSFLGTRCCLVEVK